MNAMSFTDMPSRIFPTEILPVGLAEIRISGNIRNFILDEFNFDTSKVRTTDSVVNYFSGASLYFKDGSLVSLRYPNGDYIEFNPKGLVIYCRTHDGSVIENPDGFMSLTDGFKL